MKPIYKPKGKALEYSPDALALNIYTGCPHSCTYCFAPSVLRKSREEFHSHVEPRKSIIEATAKQIEREGITGKLIHLSFVCDPYPVGYDTTVTREIIKLIKGSGNHVQILTKGSEIAARDHDLLDSNDWFGVTYTGGLDDVGYQDDCEPYASDNYDRMTTLALAKYCRIKTWVSCEPVIDETGIYNSIKCYDFIDLYRIGKMNYHPSDINWGEFGHKCVELCKKHRRNYYIKDDLRKEMENHEGKG